MNDKQEAKFQELTGQPVGHLVCKMAVPTIISMMVTACYNMVDTYFVGQLHSNSATGAVGVVFSLMAVIQAVGFFFGHGSGNYISRQLGRHETADAEKMAATGVTLAFLAGCVILVLGQIFLTPLARLLGSTDTILPYTKAYLSVILLGAGAGVIASTVNPFATGIAAGFAGVSLGEGIFLRLLEWVVFEGAAIWYVSAYAARIKRDPSRSVVGIGAGRLHADVGRVQPLTRRHAAILLIFAATFLTMIYGVIPFDEMGLPLPVLGWWFPELSALFLVAGIVVGLMDRLSEVELAETFVSGCTDLLGVAFIIGISRGITVLMNDGHITDTILHWGETALSGLGSTSFVLLVFLIYLPLSVLIPSSSGLATLSVPVVAPLGQFAGVGGDVVVTAFQSACGLVNLVTPTAAVVMGALALGRIPYEKWLKFVWKLMLLFLLLTGLLLVLAAALS